MVATNPKDILVRISNQYIKQYANDNSILSKLDIARLKESDIEPILQAIEELPKEQQDNIMLDLRHVAELSDKKRINELFAALQKEAAASLPEFRKIGSSPDKAIWTLLHHPKLFEKALYLTSFYTQPGTFTKFTYQTNHKPNLSKEKTDQLAKCIRQYFLDYNGTGEYCEIEHHRFNNKIYLIANPSEYPDNKREYQDDGCFISRKRHDAFTVVFIFSEDGNAVDIYVDAKLQVKKDLFAIWAKEIMDIEEVDSDFKPSFNIGSFKDKEQNFTIDDSACVDELCVYGLEFIPSHDPSKSYKINANIRHNKEAVYEELEAKALKPVSIKKVWIEARYYAGDKLKTKRFEVGNHSCNLKHEGIDEKLRLLLKEIGIDSTV